MGYCSSRLDGKDGEVVRVSQERPREVLQVRVTTLFQSGRMRKLMGVSILHC